MNHPQLSVVIPLRDEVASLPAVDRELREALGERRETSEILYVDDGSIDGTARALREIVGRHPGVAPRTRALVLKRNYGQTAALAAGFAAAEGDVVVAMDGDGQHDPRDIPRLLAKLDEGHDVVSGWRRHRQDRALSRRLPSVVANWVLSRLSGVRLHDFGCTLKAYRAPLLAQVHLYGEMHRFLPAHLHRIGARVTELEVAHRPRLAGHSKYGADRIFRVLLDLVLIRFLARYFTRPMHFFGKVGLWFFFLGGAVGALAVVFKLGWLRLVGIGYHADFIQTPLPVLAVSLWLGAVSSLFFGILAEILVRVLYESQGLTIYAIADCRDSAAPVSASAPPLAAVRGGAGAG